MIKSKANVLPLGVRGRTLKKVSFIFIFLVVAMSLSTEVYANLSTLAQQQQKKQISGRVIDESGEPIIGANVIEKGTTNGTVTDFDGNFSLQIENDVILHVSYIGYLSQDIPMSGKTSIEFVLVEDTKTLDEKVVIGYGTVKKMNLISAVSSVKQSDIGNVITSDVGSMIQWRVSGVSVVSPKGVPGAGSKILVRGIGILYYSDPRYIIDWMSGSFASVNNYDIESIEVLKVASTTAMYGARASQWCGFTK
jgi:hypothetical protein